MSNSPSLFDFVLMKTSYTFSTRSYDTSPPACPIGIKREIFNGDILLVAIIAIIASDPLN